ncbi:IclR family transcriptional regulator [Frankia sp. QA3]|uniref:IclR family transcriptional regulator n=1 Tax=Frankia sp. QA3 TaxID=710111 RepID=UPI000269BF8F|nr:IclR family transcriptional regulator [Frankia sp. QA3]EIV92880.1 transcriptional regulator [Frankia sp. QA3]
MERTLQDGIDHAGDAASRSVVTRALQVLAAFTERRPEMNLTDLARYSGLPLSTSFRIVKELVAWGALERDSTGRYRIGLRLWETAMLAPRTQGLRELALPILEDLSQVTRETVQLAIREGSQVVFVERIAGTGAVPVLSRAGGRFALTATGVGLVLLAHAPTEVQRTIVYGRVPRFTEYTLTDPVRLQRVLADVRANGFSVSDRQVTSDALSVAAPVRAAGGIVAAAVGIVVRHGSASPHALAPLVRSSANAVSRALNSEGGTVTAAVRDVWP